MRIPLGMRAAGVLPVGLLLLIALLSVLPARADGLLLAIRLAAGESAIFAVDEIERIGFEGQQTLVVVAAGDTTSHATGSVERIEFLWDFSSVADPRNAAVLIEMLYLFQNQPNPFSPATWITFELPQAGEAELGIYAADGRLIRRLLRDARATGRHTVRWDGLDDAGRAVAGGVYFYSLRAPGIEESRRMILLP